MAEFLEFLNQNIAVLTVFFTGVVAVSTVVYAVLTWKLVSETRKMREVQTEPKIYIGLESYEDAINIIRLNIKNIGMGPASDLQFDFSVISGGNSAEKLLEEFTNSNFFKIGLRHLGPGQNIYSPFTQTTKDPEGKTNSVLSFKVNFKGPTGKLYAENISIDMAEMIGRYQLGKTNLYSIAKSLERIQKDFSKIISPSRRVKTENYSSKDRQQERRRYLKQNRQNENT